jgi:3-hydroxybutyryl-CoA dehydrogenase
MTILVIGDGLNLQECKDKFGTAHQYIHEADVAAEDTAADIVMDFTIDEEPERAAYYATKSNTIYFLNTAKITLAELAALAGQRPEALWIGFNGLPTFLNRPLVEVSLSDREDENRLQEICNALGTGWQLVDDRVGLVTPRIICMIINEAYFTVQEGTATRDAIDQGMKLGTNYPYGPFEWCARIGIQHVYEVLEAVYEDTRDERYKICPLLKREYLLNHV